MQGCMQDAAWMPVSAFVAPLVTPLHGKVHNKVLGKKQGNQYQCFVH
jgi:hypothetical protein